MKKTLMGPKAGMMGTVGLIYPMPVLLVGADIDDKPNVITVAWGGIGNFDPPMISVAINHRRYTLKGIRQNMTFSVNVPSIDLVAETDYCGIVSGAKVDKIKVCKFNIFYGKLKNAPLIEQCPINVECKVIHLLDLGSHSLVIGRIEETYVSESCLTNGKPDFNKTKPFTYTPVPSAQYHTLGDGIAKAYSIGKKLEPKTSN